MTKKERAERAKIKKRMQANGILPPDKKKLNRRKFAEEARKEWNARDKECYIWDTYLLRAVNIMMGDTIPRTYRLSSEAVGAAKCLKLALRLKDFEEMVKARGDKTYTVKEQYDYIRDIIEA